jgi:hypothetical protein
MKDGCVKPVRGPITEASEATGPDTVSPAKEVIMMQARVGKAAPDFEASGFIVACWEG